MPSHSVDVWAQVVPIWWKWDPPSLRGIKVAKITQRRPDDPQPGCVLLKLRVTIPESAFVSFMQAEVTVPAEAFESIPPLSVEALPPGGGDES